MKILLSFLFLLGPLLVEEPSVEFAWQLSGRNEDGSDRAIQSRRKVKLKGGDGIRFLFRGIDTERVFLYHQGGDGTLSIFEAQPQANGESAFPEDDQWIFLDRQPATEVFTVVAVLKGDEELLGLHKKHLEAPSEASSKAILDLLAQRKQEASALVVQGEKPLAIAGSLRAVGKTKDLPFREVKVGSFYVKTLKVQH